MTISLVEITPDQVVGLNRSVIEFARSQDSTNQERHNVRDRSGVMSCIGGIFQQLNPVGYMHLPIEKMAGLILFRVAQGQYFENGNKRTALLSTRVFLGNNGLNLRTDKKEVSDLMWGFAPPMNSLGTPPKYNEVDSIQFVFDNVLTQ